jgi:hypothetical protein
MSLDEKIINPLAPAEPGQNPDLLPKAGKKRRKGEGGASRKAKKIEDDDEDGSADMTAVLKMDEAPRKQKKMLFEPDADSAAVSLAPAIAKKDNGSTRAALSGTAAMMPAPVTTPSPVVPPAPAPKVVAPAASEPDPVSFEPTEPQPPAAAERADEPKPEPAEPSQASLDLDPVDAGLEQSFTAAAEDIASNTPETATEESFDSQDDLASSEAETAAEPSPETPSLADLVDDDAAAAAPSAASVFEVSAAEQPAELSTTADANESANPHEPPPAPVAQPTPTPVAQPAPMPAPVAAVASQPKPPQPAAEPEAPARLSRSEMIARAARMSALSSSRANGSAAAAAPAPRPAVPPQPQPPQQQRPMELPKHAGDLYGYWTRVKNGRRFPSRADFDVEQMAENFPNSMLLTCGANGGSQVNFSSILRLGANRRSQPGDSLNFTSMITEWILAIGGEAVRAGTPVQDTEVFPSPDGTFAYKIVALPLSDQQTRVEHVLCHLSRS